ncbi:MAG: dienelactone hydrolase family protein [Alphaproteobacteria bacterium]|nr:dienelactone hydrolase family protein [Alphaproteobacteria bacterium]
MRWILIALLSLALPGCYLSRSADEPDELARTWAGATVAVPLSLYDPDLDDVRGSMRANKQALLSTGLERKIPTVVFLHGCSGLHGGYRMSLDFLSGQGYAVIAPDSFSRVYKPKSCDWRTKSAGYHVGVVGFRLAEAEHAVAQVKQFPWVDPDRVVLMGQSEGGLTTANYDADGIAAKVVLGWTCRIPWPPLWRLDGPDDLPVMSVVSARDRWFEPWYVKGHCGEHMERFADATSVVLEGSRHHVMREQETRDAVAAFLARVAPTPKPVRTAATR